MEQALLNQHQLEEELRGLKDILTVAQVVVSSLEIDEVLANILGSAMAVMEMTAGSIALYDSSSNKLELHAHQGLSSRFVSHDRWTVKQGGLTDTILAKGELFIVDDTSRTDFFRNPLAVEEGIRSLIAVPLKIQDKPVGILYVNDFVPRQFCNTRLRLLEILGSFASMSIDNARLHEQTRELACTDGLTGLYNHRQFKKVFSEELARARRYNNPLVLIMLDIDDFKLFNDLYGHPAGDKALVGVAEIISDTLRDCDTIFRYGGEEFIAILPESELAEALTAAERLRERIEAETSRYLDDYVQSSITVSVGVAAYPRDGQTFDGLLKAVDDLLYVAKRQGKNRVNYLPG
ncbi:MAG TPA: sensor domain-containing diguanylate cyclase [Geothermobacteraceae bacterium]|nr:sensor domain-containing diguanylate cyclase [Geothermobacteraceae bacterium]